MSILCRSHMLRVFPEFFTAISRISLRCRSSCICFFKFRDCNEVQTLSHNYFPVEFNIRNYAKKAGKMAKGGKASTTAILSDDELSEVINVQDLRAQLLQVREKLKRDFIEYLSLRSSANAIDNIKVQLEGEDYPLHELAQISKKNPNLIAINMVEFPNALKAAVQAILDTQCGLNPQQEGTMIYVSVPKLTREHRETLAKNAKSLFIKAKDEIRYIQNFFVREAKKRTDVSKDLIFSASNQIMSISEQSSTELENIMKTKQRELLSEKSTLDVWKLPSGRDHNKPIDPRSKIQGGNFHTAL